MLNPKHLAALGSALAVIFTPVAGRAAPPPAPDCQAVGRLEPICGFGGSEDLEVVPGGRGLLVSESNFEFDAEGMHWHPGHLGFLDLTSGQHARLYPNPRTTTGPGPWGDPLCPGEAGATLSPHGIHLSQRKDGKWQLLVVNHGSRESVEFFEVSGLTDKTAPPSLSWRGCLALEPTRLLNDVVALPGGGLLVTDMGYNTGPGMLLENLPKASRGENTGRVLRWRPGRGVDEVPGTDAPLPNGLQIDRQGRTIFVAASGPDGGEIRKIALASGKGLGATPVPHPDNISWGPDGRLLVSSLPLDSDFAACIGQPSAQPCPAAFQVVAVDPASLATETLLRHQGLPLGASTVAVQVGRHLYVGSFAGGRILKAPLPKL